MDDHFHVARHGVGISRVGQVSLDVLGRAFLRTLEHAALQVGGTYLVPTIDQGSDRCPSYFAVRTP